jgi:hypothetical protein
VTVLKKLVHGPIDIIEQLENGQDTGFELKKNIDQSPILVTPLLLYAYISWLYLADIVQVLSLRFIFLSF